MKRPAFQFYPADWRKDSALQICSIAARGLWIEVMCIMHESDQYGHLSINGKPMSSKQLARLVGESENVVDGLLAELEDAGVFSRTEEGCIFSRRMVNDESLRNVRAVGGKDGAEHGSKGGNHGAKGGRPKREEGGLNNPPSAKNETPLDEENTPPLKPPPSSSSSTSVGIGEVVVNSSLSPPASRSANAHGNRLPDDWVLPKAYGDWAVSEKGLTAERVRQIADKFRDYWRSVPGAKGRKACWLSTWRNWVREDIDRSKRGNGRETNEERSARTTAEAMKILGITPEEKVIEGEVVGYG
ncbi:MAG: hypothetical protein LBI35_05155 [Burkholderiales bacterium]|jgi:hypothetical protein|nr:hypothetical protein [Burkholderiales bacterium]